MADTVAMSIPRHNRTVHMEASKWMLGADGRLLPFMIIRPSDNGEYYFLCMTGIGDFTWVWSKFRQWAEGKDCTFIFPETPDNRVKQYLDWMGVTKYAFDHAVNPADLRRFHCNRQPEDLDEPGTYIMQVNGWIENCEHNPDGTRTYPLEADPENAEWRTLATWCPWLEAENPTIHRKYVWEPGSTEIAVHCSLRAYQNCQLDPRVWMRMILAIEDAGFQVRLYGYEPKEVPSGSWDLGFTQEVQGMVERHRGRPMPLEPYYNRPFDEVMDRFATSAAFIGVDSGMSIMAQYLGVPTLRGFSHWLRYMPGTYELPGHKARWCFLADMPYNEALIDECPKVNRGLVRTLPQFLKEVQEQWS